MICRGTLKQAVEFLFFKKENFEELEQFVTPLIVQKTKKFNSKGRVSIQIPTGNLAFEDGDILIKFSNEKWLAMTEKEFIELFRRVE
ncbi:hypothetical protein ABE888_13390 [Enterococcus faecalis]|uniref:hypothetical protein n=1 Tax=Enterococcus faecalis TaxID=1351 RepID=UPI003D6B85AF